MSRVIHKTSLLELNYRMARKKVFKRFSIPACMIIVGFLGFFSTGIGLPLGSQIGNTIIPMFWGIGALGIVSSIVLAVANQKLIREASDIVKTGIDGEARALNILSQLPNEFTVISDVQVKTTSGESQMDFVILSDAGMWIIETKNMNGTITGSIEDRNWQQNKVGRGGTPYSKTFFSPVKQVGTHTYRLKEYFKENGVRQIPWIQGVVFFSNDAANVQITSDNAHPVFSESDVLLEYLLWNDQERQKRGKFDKESVLKHLVTE